VAKKGCITLVQWLFARWTGFANYPYYFLPLSVREEKLLG